MAHLENAGTRSARVDKMKIDQPEQSRRNRNRCHRLPALLWLIVVLAWELGTRSGSISRLFFPAPSTILNTLANMLTSGKLLTDLGYTLLRFSLGLAFGGCLGLLLGLLMGWSQVVRVVANPIVAAIHPLPKLALLPLALIIFGIGEQSRIVLIALTAFFPLLINSMAGVQQIDNLTLEVARHYGVRGWTLIRRVILPGSLPMILAGIQLAVNAALLVTVSVELVTAHQGLGATIWLAWQTLRVEELYATLLVIALLGLITNRALEWLTTYALPWQRSTEQS